MTYIAVTLRKEVIKRAKNRCEYCHLPESYAYYSHEIDHIYAEKHGGATESKNLCLACADCNRHKSSDICSIDPLTQNIVPLFHPRTDDWALHFLLLNTGVIEAKTPQGRVTARILDFNNSVLVSERKRLMSLGLY